MTNSSKYCLSDNTWDAAEVEAGIRVLRSGMYTMGENVKRFEEAFAAHFGAKYAVMSNSGSSANLLMLAAIRYSGRLQPGDEILVTAVSWGTSYFPIEQCGFKTRLVDVSIDTLNVDPDKLERAITKETKAILAVNLLGNPNDYRRIQEIADAHGLLLLEDNCESMGASYCGRMCGTVGVAGSFSTFFSHHLCTMEGGVTVTDDKELYQYMLSIRAHGWTRNLPKENLVADKSDDDFYESFRFVLPGYNLRPLEIEAAIGMEQLKKLHAFVETRRANAAHFKAVMDADGRFLYQQEIGQSSWFGFAIVLKPEISGRRDAFIAALKKASIEVRPIVAGNFARQTVTKHMHITCADNLPQANYVHDNGFFVGNHSTKLDEELDYLGKTLAQVK